MWFLTEASKAFSSTLGSLVYHFLLLLAIEAALAMAWGEWRRARREQPRRLCIAMGAMLLVRLPYIVASLLAFAGWIARFAWIPPLERFADTAGIALLGWAFIPPPKRGARTWDLVFGLNVLAAVVACVALTVLWSSNPQSDYNAFWQATFWGIWQMGLSFLAGLAVVRSRDEGWAIFLSAMVVLFAGQLVQLIQPTGIPHVPLWERLANLLAYPLIAIAIYQNIVGGLHLHSRRLEDISQASLDQIKSLLFLFEAGQQIFGSLDFNVIVDNAARGIARALIADECAIAFPETGKPGQMRLVAIYNPSRQGRGEAVAFPVEYQLLVQQAMRRKRYVIAEESDNVQLKVLFALMGSAEVGPILVQPLVVEGEAIGAIIVGNSRSQRSFTPNEAKLCQSMADQLLGAIQNARRYQDAQDELDGSKEALDDKERLLRESRDQAKELADRLAKAQAEIEDLTRREEADREERKALEIELGGSQADMEALTQRLAVLETDLKQAHDNLEAQLHWHDEELARRQAEWDETVEVAQWTQSLLQSMTAGILLASSDALIQEANLAAEILLDRDYEELQGLELGQISDDSRWQRAVASAGEGEAVRLTTRIGANTLMCDVAPWPDLDSPQGQTKGIIVILQDISAEVEEQQTYLQNISSMVDELRTPMTSILSYADLLLSEAVGIVGESQRKFLSRIQTAAERLVGMTNDVNRLIGGEEWWASPRRQPVDINKLVESALAGCSDYLEDRALAVELDLSENLSAIEADPDHLRRVLSYLLSNACLASAVGGRIEVRTAQTDSLALDQKQLSVNGDSFVTVSVRDAGGGLSDEALRRVFDRTRPSRTPSGLGESGAGLNLVKTLVEAHGGRLWVESEIGVGTTFSFVLPMNDRPTPPIVASVVSEQGEAVVG